MKGRKISPHEDEILYWVAHGLTDAQIAKKMRIAPSTANVHIQNIRKKVRLHLSCWARDGVVTKTQEETAATYE